MTKQETIKGDLADRTKEFEKRLISLFDEFGSDGFDFGMRIFDLVAANEFNQDEYMAAMKEEGRATTIKRLAHEYREEQRLDLMIEHARETGHSLDDLEKSTRGMRPPEVETHLAGLKGQVYG